MLPLRTYLAKRIFRDTLIGLSLIAALAVTSFVLGQLTARHLTEHVARASLLQEQQLLLARLPSFRASAGSAEEDVARDIWTKFDQLSTQLQASRPEQDYRIAREEPSKRELSRVIHDLADQVQAEHLNAHELNDLQLQANAAFSAMILGAIAVFAFAVFRPLVNRVELTTWELLEAQQLAEHQAFHDSLTGLPNRRYLIDHLDRILAHAERSQAEVALIHVDLDGFKAINDASGHDAGDRALKAVSEAMAAERRRGDFLARIGGDEFALVVSEGGAMDGLDALAARLNFVVQAIERQHTGGTKISLSIGIAISGVPEGYSSISLSKRADEALYVAKKMGRAMHCFDPISKHARTTRPLLTAAAS